MIRLGVAALALLLGAAPAAADPPSRRDLEAATARVLAHEEALSSLWPGFWPPGQPFILHHPETGAVFAGAAAPGGAEFRPGPLPGADGGYELDYPSGAPNTVALRYDGDLANLATLFHEQFHDYQSDHFRWRGSGGEEFVDVSAIPDRAAFAAGAQIERQVLAEALGASRREQRRRLAARYLTLRDHRLASLEPSVASAEAHREWSEGTAEYVGLSGASVVAGDPRSVTRWIIEGLSRDLNEGTGGFAVNWFRWRAYSVGASLAWLLDDLLPPDEDWRGRIEKGGRLDELLREAVGQDVQTEEAPALLNRYGYEDLQARMAASLERAPPAPGSREEFLASAPRRVEISIAVPPERIQELKMSFQAKGITPLPGEALALTEVGYSIVRIGDVDLMISDRPVLSEMAGATVRQTVLLSDFEDLEAVLQTRESLGERGPIDVDLSWLRLSAGAATVERQADEIRLHITP